MSRKTNVFSQFSQIVLEWLCQTIWASLGVLACWIWRLWRESESPFFETWRFFHIRSGSLYKCLFSGEPTDLGENVSFEKRPPCSMGFRSGTQLVRLLWLNPNDVGVRFARICVSWLMTFLWHRRSFQEQSFRFSSNQRKHKIYWETQLSERFFGTHQISRIEREFLKTVGPPWMIFRPRPFVFPWLSWWILTKTLSNVGMWGECEGACFLFGASGEAADQLGTFVSFPLLMVLFGDPRRSRWPLFRLTKWPF